jgi:hypothetical protein
MLIFFKPWRTVADLKMDDKSWVDAFNDFQMTSSRAHLEVMDNMQVLHECKDCHDDHFVHRQTHKSVDCMQRTSDITLSSTDISIEPEDDDIIEHLESIESCYSKQSATNMDRVVSCLEHAQQGGLFLRHSNLMSIQESTGFQFDSQVNPNNLQLEHDWKEAYDAHCDVWKKKTTQSSCSSSDIPLTKDEHLIPVLQSNSNFEGTSTVAMEPQMAQNILPSHMEPPVDIEQVIHDWRLNDEQMLAFKIIAEHSLKQHDEPLRMYLAGPAGTGKSRVINALKDFFMRRNHKGCCFRLASYMGIAARNISGMTLHSALSLND